MARAGSGRGMGDDGWFGDRVVEELDSEVDGGGGSSSALALASRGGVRSRRSGAGCSDSSDGEGDSHDSEGDSEPDEREREMVEAALARIRRAQTKGKKEVKLSKEELAALERRRKRMQGEAERTRKKAHRVSVPLSQYFDMSSPDLLPAHPSPADLASDSQQRSASRGDRAARRRSGAAPSRGSPDLQRQQRGESPFRFSYVQQPPQAMQRHVSDTSIIGRPPSNGALPHEEGLPPHAAFAVANASAPAIPGAFMDNGLNPFQFMTGDSPAQQPRPHRASERRYHSGPLPNGRGRHDYGDEEASDGASEEASDLADDEPRPPRREPLAVVSSNGKRHSTSSSGSGGGGGGRTRHRGRSRENPIIVEDASPSPEPEHRSRSSRKGPVVTTTTASASASASASPTAVRRKPVTPVSSGGVGVGAAAAGASSRQRRKR